MENFEPKPQTPNTTDNQPAAMPEANTAAEKTMQPPASAPAENNGNAKTNAEAPEANKGNDAPPAAEAKAEASAAPEKQTEATNSPGAPSPAANPVANPVLTIPPNGVPPYMAYLPKGPSLSKRVREAVLTADNGHKAVGLFAGALVICLFLANTLLNTGGAGFFFPFCVVLLYGLFYAFTGFDKLWESREAFAMQIFIFLLSLGFIYNQESLTNTVTFLTLLAVVPLHLMYCTGKSDPVEDGARVIRKAFLAVFPYTFGNFDVPYKKLFKGVRRGSKGQGVLFTVLGLVCTIPFLVILTLLFSNADFAFAQSLSSILSYFYDLPVAKIIGTILLGVLMAVYILPLFFALDADYPQPEAGSKRKGILPNAAVTAFLAVLIALEVYFSYFQVRYLFLNLGTLPEGVSYAEYARGGFFEIAAATLLTVALIFAATVLTRRDEDEELPLSVRLLLTVFSACVVLMFASSYYRMLMYMDAYSMTIRRVGVCWLMALMLAVLIGVIIYIWKPDFALTRYTIFTVLVFVLALNLMHLGATVSKNNVDRYFQEQEAEVKTGYQLDENYLYTLLPASAPDLARLLETPDYASYDLRVTLNDISEQEQSWRAWNYDWYRAQKACDAVEKPKSLWVVLQVSTQLQAPVSALNFEMKQGNKTLAAGRLNKSDGSVFLPGDRIEINYADFSPISSKQDLTLYSFRFEAVLENNTYVAADAMVSDPYTEDGRLRLTLIPNDANDFFTVRVG